MSLTIVHFSWVGIEERERGSMCTIYIHTFPMKDRWAACLLCSNIGTPCTYINRLERELGIIISRDRYGHEEDAYEGLQRRQRRRTEERRTEGTREREREVEIYVTGESASIACCKRAGSCPLLATLGSSGILICDWPSGTDVLEWTAGPRITSRRSQGPDSPHPSGRRILYFVALFLQRESSPICRVYLPLSFSLELLNYSLHYRVILSFFSARRKNARAHSRLKWYNLSRFFFFLSFE